MKAMEGFENLPYSIQRMMREYMTEPRVYMRIYQLFGEDTDMCLRALELFRQEQQWYNLQERAYGR